MCLDGHVSSVNQKGGQERDAFRLLVSDFASGEIAAATKVERDSSIGRGKELGR
jgi:hypothetical protein